MLNLAAPERCVAEMQSTIQSPNGRLEHMEFVFTSIFGLRFESYVTHLSG